MTNAKYFIRIVWTVTGLVLGLFSLSALAELALPGTWTRWLTIAAYASAIAIAVPVTGTAMAGLMAAGWYQSKTSRRVLEVPAAGGSKFYALIPEDEHVILVDLASGPLAGLEVDPGQRAPRCVQPVSNPAPALRQRAPLVRPVVRHDLGLWQAYQQFHGDNGK